MSTAPGQPDARLALLTEFHQQTLHLYAWASNAIGLIRQRTPDWAEVHLLFSEYRPLREWLYENREVLTAFEGLHSQAVEWAGIGWSSWHSTIVEACVVDGHQDKLMLWLGTREDTTFEHLICPSQLDWRHPMFSVKGTDENTHICPSRDLAWRRIRSVSGIFKAGDPRDLPLDPESSAVMPAGSFDPLAAMSNSGWCYLGETNPWIHAGHLKSEYAAVARLLNDSGSRPQPTGATGDPPEPRARVIDAAGLTEALGLPPEAKIKVALALKRHREKNQLCGFPQENRLRDEDEMVYRVRLVWPILLEHLARWKEEGS